MPVQKKLSSFFKPVTSESSPKRSSRTKTPHDTDKVKIMSPPKRHKLCPENENECSELSKDDAKRIEQNKLSAQIKLQHKKTPLLPTDIGVTWYSALEKEFKKDYFQKLNSFVESERKTKEIFPNSSSVWSFTKHCDINEIKVVILGQDPYHGPRQAHGLCFSVQKGIAVPPSLRNMYKELSSDIENFEVPSHGYLCGWATQGVLLLNAVLTVRSGEPNSHKERGWENITNAIIKYINENLSNVVFLLWGKDAQKKGAFINRKNHCVLMTTHPSPLSASRGFIGCKHFSKTNEYLKEHGKDLVDWNHLPDPQ
ncbi:Uracil-DNA glycosylase [Nymphon striatum]|nr:Uracil-DNA glycosylase [Nymphon striatum]